MMLKIILIIFIISFIWALFSLKKNNEKQDIEKIKRKLNKGRVLYQSHHSA